MGIQAYSPSFVIEGLDSMKIIEKYSIFLYLQDHMIIPKTKRSNYVLDQKIMFCQVNKEMDGYLQSYLRFSRVGAR
jgi:hypothetical protein